VVDDIPETLYVRSADGVHIAYQILGDHRMDLVVMPGGSSHLEVEWESPELAGFLRRLASFARVIRFDMRGTGLSDPANPNEWPTLERRADDALAVLDAIGSERAALMGGAVGGQLAAFFAAAHPERTSALVLAGATARFAWAPDYAWGRPADGVPLLERQAEEGWERGVGALRFLAPSMLSDEAFVSWWYRLFRHSTGRGASRALLRAVVETDLRPLLPTIQAPTLVLSRSGDEFIGPAHARYLAEHISHATLVELPGEDNLVYVGETDAVIGEIEEFLTGVRHAPATERVLATVLFTDIVGSTERAAELGDRRWRDLLDAHDRAVRRQLERFRGREVNTLGDGFVATFDGPGRAILCACAIRGAVRALGIEVRAGLHTGEIEVRGNDVAGLAVHIGARVSALAGGGEVLASSTVKDLVAGSGIEFTDRGERELKGVPGSWRLYSVNA
jgi:class 3 adenylate cyclase/alpha-beta hydrolase superfamily lysophospholipase